MAGHDNAASDSLAGPQVAAVSPMQGFLWGLLAVAFWSTSATMAGVLADRSYYFEIVLLMQATALVALLLYSAFTSRLGDFGRDVRAAASGPDRARFFVLMAVFAAGITIYHCAFYYALQNGPRISANIINYLWPILLFTSSALIFRTTKDEIGPYEIALLLLAFLGAACIAWDVSAPASMWEWHGAYPIALLAAFCAPVYMNASNVLKQSYFSFTPFVYIAGLMISLPILVLIAVMFGMSIKFSTGSLPSIMYLGIATVAIAHVAWTNALQSGKHLVISNLAYLVPVLSTILLVVVMDDRPSNQILFGATLIVLSNVLSNAMFRRLTAESGAILVFFYFGILVYFRKQLGLDFSTSGDLMLAGETFAIVSGFLLSRMWAKIRQEEERLTRWTMELDALVSSLLRSPATVHDERHATAVVEVVDSLIIRLSDFDASRSQMESARQAPAVREAFENFAHVALSLPGLQDAQGRDRGETLKIEKLRTSLSEWVLSKFDRATLGELIAVGALGGFGALFFVGKAGDVFFMHLFAMVLAGSVAFIVLKIRDYGNYSSINDFTGLVILQQPLRTIGRPFYIANPRLFFTRFRQGDFGSAIRVNRDGQVTLQPTDELGMSLAEYRNSKNLLAAMILLGIVVTVVLLADQKFGFLQPWLGT